MKTGKPIFINNFELGYTYTKDDAENMVEFLKKETNDYDLKVVPFASVKFNDEFANGGIMAKDGEIEYRVEYEVFVDDADDPYTDNRLKTFKDLDEAIEFANRVYASVDYEIIKDGEVVDYGYVNTTNKKLSKFENGGETDDDMGVQFIDYKDKMIMYEPHYKEYYTNDIQFDSLEKAKKYIDEGSKMTPAQINAYRMGAMAKGGIVASDGKSINVGDLVTVISKRNKQYRVKEINDKENVKVVYHDGSEYVTTTSDLKKFVFASSKMAKGGEIKVGDKFQSNLDEDYVFEVKKVNKNNLIIGYADKKMFPYNDFKFTKEKIEYSLKNGEWKKLNDKMGTSSTTTSNNKAKAIAQKILNKKKS